ncbi:oxalate:formate antiporter-like isoform x1 [Plakobranchus ocellatus]|uniref:Oxalate:formate antiporter-like isoform x1 n=1 Tax=Plakobranchus ocellatus TaxID=259542 RepID=A0AAV4ARC4_9GAST|nr:oxalate:formate antiporter-like isoform x1 [Plakobranchus ocellatus]
MWDQKRKWIMTKYCSVIGAHFLTAPMTFTWTYGNLAPYLNSYVKFSSTSDFADGNTQWIFYLWLIGNAPGLFLVAPLVKIVGLKRLGIFSMLLCSLALLVSAWMLHESMIGTCFFMGFLNGVSVGLTASSSLMYVNGWIPEKSSTFTATVTSSAPIIAVIQNQIVTAYVNPLNLSPDVHLGSSAYFSQPSILDRVPGAILILAGTIFGIQAVGFILVTNPPPMNSQTHNRKTKDTVKLYATFRHQSNNTSASIPVKTQKMNKTESNGKELLRYKGNTCGRDGIDSSATQPISPHATRTEQRFVAEASESNGSTSGEWTPAPTCKPSQALKTRPFWTLWFYAASISFAVIIKNSNYKVFGLLYIPDDQFLTLAGSLIPLIEAICRTVFGAILDKKILNIKDCFVFALSSNSVLFAFFYFAPQLHRLAYILLILGLSASHSAISVLVASGIFSMYGSAYFPFLFAVTFMASTASTVVSAFIVTPILKTLGWFWLFISPSIFSSLVLGLVIITEFKPSIGAEAEFGKRS